MKSILDLVADAEAQLEHDVDLGLPQRTYEQRSKLLLALRRLLAGRPTNPDLVALREDTGRVPITPDTVATEANVARQRFSGKMSKHPIVSELVALAKQDHGVAPNTTVRIQRLSNEKRMLTQALRASRSAQACHILRVEELERKLSRIERREARKSPTP